jgi:hypothetical protein
MFTTGLLIGIFLGANISIILSGWLMHAKMVETIHIKNNDEDLLT